MNTVTSSPAVGGVDDPAGDGAVDNAKVAGLLRDAAALLDSQKANPFRAAAYRKAADTIGGLATSVRRLFESGGRAGLDALPSVGPGIAGAIAEILVSGRWSQLDRLRGGTDSRHLFTAIPGIGATLSERIHDELEIDTLEALEAAAHDGRLEHVQGIGARRASAVRAVLAQLLARTRAGWAASASAPTGGDPPVAALLDVDLEYRVKAQTGRLPTVAPRRFNPRGESWLPVLHAGRGSWHFTAFYSNTARAHELGREHDWVVIYCYDGDHREHQHTVVTERRGPLAGRRVVRGRERECREWYERAAQHDTADGGSSPVTPCEGRGRAHPGVEVPGRRSAAQPRAKVRTKSIDETTPTMPLSSWTMT